MGRAPGLEPQKTQIRLVIEYLQNSEGRYHRSMKPVLVLLAAAAVMPNLSQLQEMNSRFAPVKPKYDEASLSAGDKKAPPKLVEAAKVLNCLFMDQYASGCRALYPSL